MIETKQASTDSAAVRAIETARLLVLGYMAPVLFHEISNVLTVVSGIRQTCFRDDGEPAPGKVLAKVPHMIDEQARKSEALYETFKRLAPRPAQEKPCTTLSAVADEIESFLELRVRGRRVKIARKSEGADRALGAERAHRIKIVALCLAFASLDPVIRGHQPADVSITTRTAAGAAPELWIEYRIRAARDLPPEHALELDDPTLQLCRGLLATEGACELRLQSAAGSIRVRFDRVD
ncbi:MAG: hypothetical protein U1E76_19595 [Planctomycetota bacterium]